MSKIKQENSANFDDLEDLVRSELNNFCSYVNRHDYENVTQEIHFELKARVKYVETLWDMFVSSFKHLPEPYLPNKGKVDRYFKAIGKAKMINNKFATENKIWQ